EIVVRDRLVVRRDLVGPAVLLVHADTVLETDPIRDMPAVSADPADAPVKESRPTERPHHARLVWVVPEVRTVVIILGAGAEPSTGPLLAVTVDLLVAFQKEDALAAPRVLHGDIDADVLAVMSLDIQDGVLLAALAVRILDILRMKVAGVA